AEMMKTLTGKVTEMDNELKSLKEQEKPQEQASTLDSITDNLMKLLGTSINLGDLEKKQGKQKSGKELRAEDNVSPTLPWPQVRVLKPHSTKGVPYDDLSPMQFAYGYMQLCFEPQMAETKDVALENLLHILEDLKDFPEAWVQIRTCHSLTMGKMERGAMSWEDRDEMYKMRQKYVFPMGAAVISTTPCPEYNKGTCSARGDHDQLRHICSYCQQNLPGNPAITHARVSCWKLNGKPSFSGAPQKAGDSK
ncbi:MAG: hypothetical protein GY774_37885, partial [Planctomycetes bacterium]|nr:hypothetical protein [Planctomycetota bacterium]